MKTGSVISSLLFFSVLFASCTESRKALTEKNEASQKAIRLPDSLVRKQATGIDFYAQGNDPVSWTLEMDVDKAFVFKTTNGIYMSVPAVKPVQQKDIQAIAYTITNTQGDMHILLFEVPCGTGKKAEVTVNNTRYTGCGNDLYNAEVNGTWILEKAGNNLINAKDFPAGVPKLQFSIAAKEMKGSDGCSNISSPIEMKGSRIQFGNISGSKSGCKNETVRKIFMEKISGHTADYYFRDGKLYLYLVDDSILIFKKG